MTTTNQRVWIAHGIVLFKKARSLPLDKIQDATYRRSFWTGTVEISSAGGPLGTLKEDAFRPARAKQFVAELNALRQTIHAPSSHDDDPLRRLAALRDEGILTPEEFEAKKAELLRRI
jgi:hypothetical protein